MRRWAIFLIGRMILMILMILMDLILLMDRRGLIIWAEIRSLKLKPIARNIF